MLGVPTGTQDHYPAAFGGAMVVILDAGGERREVLRVDPEELENRLALCYTGRPRRSGINNWKIFQDHLNGDRHIHRSLDEIASVARAMREALASGDWDEAGRLMREEWSFRRRTLPGTSTATIDDIISAARRAGALAGKACGAGGGGCVALMIPPDARERVERAVEGAEEKFCRCGLRGAASRCEAPYPPIVFPPACIPRTRPPSRRAAIFPSDLLMSAPVYRKSRADLRLSTDCGALARRVAFRAESRDERASGCS